MIQSFFTSKVLFTISYSVVILDTYKYFFSNPFLHVLILHILHM